MAIDSCRVLRTKEAAETVGLAASTLERYRQQRRGPRFVRLGPRVIGYRIADLENWLDDPAKHEAAHHATSGGQAERSQSDR